MANLGWTASIRGDEDIGATGSLKSWGLDWAVQVQTYGKIPYSTVQGPSLVVGFSVLLRTSVMNIPSNSRSGRSQVTDRP